MAKKTKTEAAPAATPERVSAFTPDEERQYVEAVIRKQCGVDAETAAKRAADLDPLEFTNLHDAGRQGQLSVVREILGLESE